MEPTNNRRKCPKCSVGYLDSRTARELWVKVLLFWLPVKRYKCSSCKQKSYVYPWTKRVTNSTLQV